MKKMYYEPFITQKITSHDSAGDLRTGFGAFFHFPGMSISLQSMCSQPDILSSPVIGHLDSNKGVELDLKNLNLPPQFTEIEMNTLDFEKYSARTQTQIDTKKQYPIKIRRKYCSPSQPLVFKPFSSMDQLELTVASLNKFLSKNTQSIVPENHVSNAVTN